MSETQGALRSAAAAAGEGLGVVRAPAMVPIQTAPATSMTEEALKVSEGAVFVGLTFELHGQSTSGIAVLARQVVEKAEMLIFEQLNDPNWDWRTIPGLQRSTGLPEELILSIIERHGDKVERVSSKRHGLLVRLIGRQTLRAPSFLSVLDRALDYLSFGKRRRLRS